MRTNQNPLTVYTSKNCPFSKQLISFLYENEIPFENIDISLSKEHIDESFGISGVLSTPIVVLKSDSGRQMILNGWNEENKQILLNRLI
jgi:arsenate reductase-like glutaredoxin family protein